jgi:hypothetical protein
MNEHSQSKSIKQDFNASINIVIWSLNTHTFHNIKTLGGSLLQSLFAHFMHGNVWQAKKNSLANLKTKSEEQCMEPRMDVLG